MAGIKDVAVYLPNQIVDNSEMESRIVFNGHTMNKGVLERLLGTGQRRFAESETQVSDMAAYAAQKIINKHPNSAIDLLIFAAASSDLIEPATANIVQAKLGLHCPVMDIKNACNSVTSAIQVASALIDSGVHKNILIVNGEKLSEVINFNPRDEEHFMQCLAGYSLGDAGSAVLVGHGDGGKLVYQKFSSWGQYWQMCTVEGGGSMAFRQPEKYYFEGNARELRSLFLLKAPEFFKQCFDESGWKAADIDCIVSHQVSGTTLALVAEALGISETKCMYTFNKYGNTAAATIPIALHDALQEGKLVPGQKLMVLGLAAGISLSMQLIEW